jgi:hypothetical protein
MGLAAYLICSLGDWTVSGNTIEKVILLGAGIIAGIGVYLASCYGMKNEEMLFLLSMVKGKMKR